MGLFGSIAGSSINSAANVAATAMTNASNERIAEQTNAHQYKMWQEQMQHDIDMWNMENQYNSPEQQVERLEQAGLNPKMILGMGSTGNAVASAGGQTPPQLQMPTMQAPNIDLSSVDRYAAAFNQYMQGKKAQSEAENVSVNTGFLQDMALKGMNPEFIKASVALQQYNELKSKNKYITPYMEAQIKKITQETNYSAWAAEERRKYCDKLGKEIDYLGLTNKFNSYRLPQILQQEAQRMKVEWEQHLKNLQIGDSQIMLNKANADSAEANAGLLRQSTETEKQKTQAEFLDNFGRGFKAQLYKVGINANDTNLPFYMGLAVKLTTGEIKPPQLQTYFDNMSEAEKIGMKALRDGHADLTNFQLWGSPSGLFGSGINFQRSANELWQNWFGDK